MLKNKMWGWWCFILKEKGNQQVILNRYSLCHDSDGNTARHAECHYYECQRKCCTGWTMDEYGKCSIGTFSEIYHISTCCWITCIAFFLHVKFFLEKVALMILMMQFHGNIIMIIKIQEKDRLSFLGKL